MIFEAVEIDCKQTRRVYFDDSFRDRREGATEVHRRFHDDDFLLFGDHALRAKEGRIERLHAPLRHDHLDLAAMTSLAREHSSSPEPTSVAATHRTFIDEVAVR